MVASGCRSRAASPNESESGTAHAAPLVEREHPVADEALERDHDHLEHAGCPVDNDLEEVLDYANQYYEAGKYQLALSCAELAADISSRSVEAHHLRASALVALGDAGRAQLALSMALAHDPNDPETLAAAADFYVNILTPRRRGSIELGLEYARRGVKMTRGPADRSTRARLLVLQAQALNDLGRSEEGVERVRAALKLKPHYAEARHELGVSLFNLCRFDAAERAFNRVLAILPDDPYAHYHLGLILERRGERGTADDHLRRARELSPDEFPSPVVLSKHEFRAEVEEAIAELPKETRELLEHVQLELVDLPAAEDLEAVTPPFAPTILGLYRGLPLGEEFEMTPTVRRGRERGVGAALRIEPSPEDIPPRAIVLYRLNLGRAVRSRAELDRQIRRTLIHEIGHLKGLDEDELRRRGLD